MLRNLIILVIISLAGWGLTGADALFTPAPPARITDNTPSVTLNALPDFAFTDQNGTTRRASDFKGRIIILNFWASWCAPCVKEFPLLLQAAADVPDEIILIALSSDTNEAAMNEFFKRQNFKNIDAKNVFIAFDENGKITREQFQTYRLPETIIIDKDGNMRDKLVGANWTADDLAGLINRY